MITTEKDYQILPYNLPDLSGTDGSVYTFSKFVDENEEEILRKLLGHDLFDEFKAGIAPEPYLIETKWAQLLDGVYYNIEGYDTKYKWGGMKRMLVPYIYAQWTKRTATTHGKNGIVFPKAENSTVIGPKISFVEAMIDFGKRAGSWCNVKDSLYGFLVSKSPDYNSPTPEYTNWKWCDPGFENLYGL